MAISVDFQDQKSLSIPSLNKYCDCRYNNPDERFEILEKLFTNKNFFTTANLTNCEE